VDLILARAVVAPPGHESQFNVIPITNRRRMMGSAQEIAGDGEGAGGELEWGVARVRVTNITIDENKTRDFYHSSHVLISPLCGV